MPNRFLSSVVTPAPIEMKVRPVQLQKAELPIFVTLSGIVIELSLVQPEKAE